MNPQYIAKETAKVVQSYLTYQAVRTIINQLSETNPGEAIWLRQYSATHSVQDGESYIEGMMLERKDLVMRIMTVRSHIAEQILEYLPEMVRSNIEQDNLAHRRQLLERLTQTSDEADATLEDPNPDTDINQSE